MPLVKVPFRPGIVKDDPPYASEGVWVDCDKARFYRGQPQKIGGWEKWSADQFSGKGRALFPFASTGGAIYLGIGTHEKLYIGAGGTIYDVTPAGFTAGFEYGIGDAGWGGDGWGEGGWGDPASTPIYPLIWSLSNWSGNMLANYNRSTLYEWTGTLTSVATAVSGAPSMITSHFVTLEEFVVAIGVEDVISSDYDPMLVRWSDQSDYTSWTPGTNNVSGGQRLTSGSRLVAGTSSRQQNLIWSNTSLIAMRYIGDTEFVFSFDVLGSNCGLIGPKAFAEKDGLAFWMSPDRQFFIYDGGAPRALVCPVRDYVFDKLVASNAYAVAAGIVSEYNEVWWFYPTDASSPELDSYVIYNYAEDTWAIGTLGRTAWAIDIGQLYPGALGSDGYVYRHEFGADADGMAMTSYAETAPFDIGDGDRVMSIQRVVPDLTLTGSVDVTLKAKRWPQDVTEQTDTRTFTTSDVKVDLRLQGRQASFRVESDAIGDKWRVGNVRFDMRAGGKR